MSVYSESHKSKGDVYDDSIQSDPMDAFMARIERGHLIEVFQNLNKKYYRRYLDFACGTGRITKVGEKYFPHCVGIDVSESMIKRAKEACQTTHFRVVDFTNEHDDEAYDIITAFRFFGNAEDDLRERVLRAINQHLRLGGLLIVNNHRNPNSINRVLGRWNGGRSRMDLTHQKLISLAHHHGFIVQRQIPIGVWVYRAALMRSNVLTAPISDRLERALSARVFVPVAPDAIYIFRKQTNV